MALIADALLIAGALAASIYCWVLARRLRGLENMDKGVGGAIASLNEQVSEMKTALRATQSVTGGAVSNLQTTTKKAEKIARRLEDYLSELDDLGVTQETKQIQTKPQLPTSPPPNQENEQELDAKVRPSDGAVKQAGTKDKSPKRAQRVDVRAPRAVEPDAHYTAPEPQPLAPADEKPASTAALAAKVAKDREKMQERKSRIIAESGLTREQIEADEALIKAHKSKTPNNVSELARHRVQVAASEPDVEDSAAVRLQNDIRRRLADRADGSDEDEFVKALQSVLAATTK